MKRFEKISVADNEKAMERLKKKWNLFLKLN